MYASLKKSVIRSSSEFKCVTKEIRSKKLACINHTFINCKQECHENEIYMK